MADQNQPSSTPFVHLALRQLPLMMRSFARQRALVFWTYGFSLVALFFGCSILGGGQNSQDLRPLMGCAVMLMTMMGVGVYGVSSGIWDFFGGAAVERYRRPAAGGSAVLAFCLARFLVIGSAVLLQLLLLGVVYRVAVWNRIVLVLITLVLSDAVFVCLGLFCATVVRTRRQTLVLANFLFASLLVLAVIPTDMLPGWTAAVGRVLPSTHTMEVLQGSIIEFAGAGEVAGSMLYLLVVAVVLGVIAVRRFDWLALNKGSSEVLEG